MKPLNYLFLFLSLTIISCSDDPMGPIDPPPVVNEIFDLQWATRIDESKEIIGTDNTQYFENWMLVTGDATDPFTIIAFNKTTGIKDWTFINNGIINDNISNSRIEDNTYLGITGKGIVAVNLETQERIWEVDFTGLNYNINKSAVIHNGFLYQNFSLGGVGQDSEAAIILKIDINTGDYQEIYRAVNDSEGQKALSPPVLYTKDNGDDIMIFNLYPDAEKPPNEDSQNVIAYNISTNTELWSTNNFTEFYYSNSLHPPIIYNDLVITGGDWSMYAFDINTGEQKWKTSVPGYDKFAIWRKTNHLIKNDRLYVNPNGLEIMCLNTQDGSVIWQNLEDAPNCSDNMVYFEKEDYLVFTSWGLGSVMVLDAFTGEKIHREHEFENSSYNNDIVYDPDTDMFFTSTYKHAIGFKINAPE